MNWKSFRCKGFPELLTFKLSISVIFLKTLIILIVINASVITSAWSLSRNGSSRHFRDIHLKLAKHFFASGSHLLGCGRVQASNSSVVELLCFLVETLAKQVYFWHIISTAVYIVAEPQIVRGHITWTHLFRVGGGILTDRFFYCTQRLKLTYWIRRTAGSALPFGETRVFNFNSFLFNLILALGRLSMLFF